ncbi:MAG: CPBP family intramembrane metalloprotease [Coriobacteriia bacterium]|nr:CPBP family intramembrane metalloprotease [Coriobacteriia bacterium]
MGSSNAPVTQSAARTGRKSKKVYILCGVVSTWFLTEVLMQVVGGIFGLIVDVPLAAMSRALLTPELGTGGVDLFNEYALFAGLLLSFLLLLRIVRPWRPYLRALGTEPTGNRPHMLVIGLVVGFAMNAVCVLGAILAGSVQLEFTQFSIVGFLAFLIIILIQASTEEVFCRGFAYQRIKRTYNTTVAILGASAIFSVGHILNPGVTPLALVDIFLTGVLYSQMVIYFDSIWLPMGVHTAWNFTQNILFGLPNSGMASAYSFFGIVGRTTSGFAYDTAFGVEGTWLAVIVNAACILALYLWGRKHGRKELDIWEGSELEAAQVEAGTTTEAAAAAPAEAEADAKPKKARWFY